MTRIEASEDVAEPLPVSTRAAGLLKTARPKQWTKNVLVLAAPGAAGMLTNPGPLVRAVVAVATFCAVSSGTYFMNDVFDVEADRRHPTKQFRPIAAGVVGRSLGLGVGLALMLTGIVAGGIESWRLGVVLALYVAVQFAYSFYLKHQPVFDLTSVAAGFVLRGIGGAVAIPVGVSEWFLIVTTFGSLLTVTGKRLAEHQELGEERGLHRATLQLYRVSFLQTALGVSAAGAILGYCLWAFSLQTQMAHHTDPIWYQISIIPILIALLRFTFLVESGKGAKPEELVLADRPLQVLGLTWAVLFGLGVYAH